MSNLYTLRDSNIRKSWLFLFGFFLLIAAIGFVLAYFAEEIIVFYAVMATGLIYTTIMFFLSPSVVIFKTHSKPLEKSDNPELYRLTENLCITAGLPMPRIYIMNTPQPNAFVTGRKPEQAIMVVTTGLLEKLERVELEGVIAHELSHIRNNDVLLGTLVVALVGSIVFLSDLIIRSGSSRGDRKEGGFIIVIIGLVIYVVSFFLAKMMQMALSRQREFLADASAALLTRYPEGLARALEKISGDESPLPQIDHSTAHLYIASPFKGRERRSWMTRAFATHPPIEDRIKRLRDLKI